MDTGGYIRLGNYNRAMAPDAAPEPGEVVVGVDRMHPILGNHRHRLFRPNDPVERARVVDAYRRDMQADFARGGPMSVAVRELVERVLAGEHLVAMCHCMPRQCHGSVIIEQVDRLVRQARASQVGTAPSLQPVGLLRS